MAVGLGEAADGIEACEGTFGLMVEVFDWATGAGPPIKLEICLANSLPMPSNIDELPIGLNMDIGVSPSEHFDVHRRRRSAQHDGACPEALADGALGEYGHAVDQHVIGGQPGVDHDGNAGRRHRNTKGGEGFGDDHRVDGAVAEDESGDVQKWHDVEDRGDRKIVGEDTERLNDEEVGRIAHVAFHHRSENCNGTRHE